MKRFLLIFAFLVFAFSPLFSQGLIISEVVDGTGSGGYPKYVELTNTSDVTIDLNGFKINLYINGSEDASLGYEFAEEFLLPSKASVVITNIDNKTDGQLWSDFNLPEPTYEVLGATGINSNGDDVYELVASDGTAIDVYGVIGDDGTGEAWEFLDSYAYRKSTVYNPSTTFDITEWYIAGANFLDDYATDMSPYLTPGTHELTTSTGSLELTYPAGGENFETGDVVTVTWNATDVDSIYIQGKKSDESAFETIVPSAIDATLGTFDFGIPEDTEEGDYQLRIVGKDDPTVADTSDYFHITDTYFAGLSDEYPFTPENGAVDVPTTLYDGRLEMHFKESVKPGTAGKIYLKKYDDDSVVKEWDVTDPAQVSTDPDEAETIFIYLDSELDAETKFYVTVDAGAVVDLAATPNSFGGISDKDTWVFTTAAAPVEVSIYDIQYTTDETGDSPYNGQLVKTIGVVMATTNYGYYIQSDNSAWSGIYVYDSEASVAVGDEITVTGTVYEYNNFTELTDITNTTVISSGNTLFEPVLITMAGYTEGYESVLVKVENVTCSNPDLGYGEWEITDGTNTGRVDDMWYAYTPTQDEAFASITGMMTYSYSNFKIEPRDASDIVTAATIIRRSEAADISVGPNPVLNELRISAAMPIVKVQVLNAVGQAVKELNETGENLNMDLSGVSKGVYLVRVTFADGSVGVRKVIKR
ncbi:MAG: T9SS type A sorting domain-containing protein [Chlorobi bacterium]|nr:T9SS type A sorting domain-containing protein [Chlorobiota bacterium]